MKKPCIKRVRDWLHLFVEARNANIDIDIVSLDGYNSYLKGVENCKSIIHDLGMRFFCEVKH